MEPGDESPRPQRPRFPQPSRSRFAQFAHHPRRRRRCGFTGGHAFPGSWTPAAGLEPPREERLVRLHLCYSKNQSPHAWGGPPATRTPDVKGRPLDADARAEISRLPNVIEVYPQIRFFTEVRYEGKPFATMVAGMPESSKASGAFDGMQ